MPARLAAGCPVTEGGLIQHNEFLRRGVWMNRGSSGLRASNQPVHDAGGDEPAGGGNGEESANMKISSSTTHPGPRSGGQSMSHDLGDAWGAAGRRRRDWRGPGGVRNHPCPDREFRPRSGPTGRGADRRVRNRNAGPPDSRPTRSRPICARPDTGARAAGTLRTRSRPGAGARTAGARHSHRRPTTSGRGRPTATGVRRR
jgi:hypothetical protein